MIFSHFLIKLNVGIEKGGNKVESKWGNSDLNGFQIEGLEHGMQGMFEKVRL